MYTNSMNLRTKKLRMVTAFWFLTCTTHFRVYRETMVDCSSVRMPVDCVSWAWPACVFHNYIHMPLLRFAVACKVTKPYLVHEYHYGICTSNWNGTEIDYGIHSVTLRLHTYLTILTIVWVTRPTWLRVIGVFRLRSKVTNVGIRYGGRGIWTSDHWRSHCTIVFLYATLALKWSVLGES